MSPRSWCWPDRRLIHGLNLDPGKFRRSVLIPEETSIRTKTQVCNFQTHRGGKEGRDRAMGRGSRVTEGRGVSMLMFNRNGLNIRA